MKWKYSAISDSGFMSDRSHKYRALLK